MRLTMPIGAPGAPGPVNRLLLGAQGSYTVSGQAAALTYAQSGSFIMPTPANTGDQSGVTRTTYSGTRNINVAGTVISHFNIVGGAAFIINANNVTFQYCRFTNPSATFVIDADTGASGLKILDCEFAGPYQNGLNAPVLTGNNAEIRRCNIGFYDNGLVLQGGTQTVVGNYINNLGPVGGAGAAHVDGISCQGGQNGVLIQGNAIYSWDTSCIIINNDFGNPSNVRVDNNWLLNQSGRQTAYPIYWSNVLGTAEMTNNFLQRGAFGYSSSQETTPQLVWSNNRNYDTNALVLPGS